MVRQILLLIVLVILNLADIATTFYGLSIGGSELNPLFQPEGVPIKIALPLMYAFLFLGSYQFCQKSRFKKGLKTLDINLAILIIIYVLVVANNLIGIMRVVL